MPEVSLIFISVIPKLYIMKFILTKFKFILAIMILSTVFVACDEEDDFMMGDDDGSGMTDDDVVVESNTIVDFVNDNSDYSSLAAAIEAAGLTETLSGDTEYTVFAPDNDAFQALLDSNDAWSSLDDIDANTLELVLMNHVQSGIVMSSDLSTGYIESMAAAGPDGENVSLYVNTDDGVMLNGMSTVETADIEVDNGVIHAVSSVIGLPDITTFATADPSFSILVSALTREDDYSFVETLMMSDDPAPFTVFAPVDDAFVALLDSNDDWSALGDIDSDLLADVLSYHVVTGANVTSGDLSIDMAVTTLQGTDFTVNVGDNVTITDGNGGTSTVVLADVQATNGVIHAIDSVLLPAMGDDSDM